MASAGSLGVTSVVDCCSVYNGSEYIFSEISDAGCLRLKSLAKH